MAGQPLAEASVQVVPDLSRFDNELKRGLAAAFRKVESQAESAGESIDDSFREAARQSDAALEQIGDSDVWGEVEREASRTGETVTRHFREAGRQSDRALDGIGISMGRLAGIAGAAFAAIGGGLLAVGAARGIMSAIDAASDLGESMNKVQVVFGEAASTVTDFAASSDTAFGISQAQALEATGTFGNLLRSVGLSEAQAATFGTTMTGLAADLGSFNNVPVDEALEAIRSGLVGETEPLKRFGVNLNEATLKAKAMELGLSDGVGPLDAAAKAQAAYALILEQTTLAQGDFARTVGTSLPNQLKVLSASFDSIKASAGQAFLPLATTAVSALNDLLPAVEAAILPAADAISGALAPAVEAIGPLIRSLLPAIEPLGAILATVATGLVETFGAIAPAIAPLLSALQPFIAALADLGPIVAEVGGAILGILTAGLEALAPLLDPLVSLASTFGEVLADVGEVLGRILGRALEAIVPIFEKLAPVLEDVVDLLGDTFVDVLEDLEPLFAGLAEIAAAFLDALGPKLPEIAEALAEVAVAAGEFLVALIPLVPILAEWAAILAQIGADTLVILARAVAAIVRALEPFAGVILAVVAAIKAWTVIQVVLNVLLTANPIGLIVVAIAALITGLVAAWQNSETFRDVVRAVWETIQRVVQVVVDFFTGLPARFSAIWTAITDGVKAIPAFFGDMVAAIVGFVASLPERVLAYFRFIYVEVPLLIGRMALQALAILGSWIANMLAKLGEFVASVPGRLAGFGANLIRNIASGFLNALTAAGTWIGNMVGKIGELASKAGAALTGFGSNLLRNIASGFTNALTAAGNWIRDMVSKIGGLPGKIAGALRNLGGSLISGIGSAFRSAWNAMINSLPELDVNLPGPLPDFTLGLGFLRLARGGVITGPTLGLLGEAGSEAVVPLTRPARALDVLDQAGLTRLVLDNRGPSSAVHVENMTIVEPVDVDLLAQRVGLQVRLRTLAAA